MPKLPRPQNIPQEFIDLRNTARDLIGRRDWPTFRQLMDDVSADDRKLEILRRSLDERGFNPDRYIERTRFSPVQNKTLSVSEMEGAIEHRKRRSSGGGGRGGGLPAKLPKKGAGPFDPLGLGKLLE